MLAEDCLYGGSLRDVQTERTIGDRRVAAVGIGAMPLSMYNAPPRSQVELLLHVALQYGHILIDTADIYAPSSAQLHHNERLIARILGRVGTGRAFVATKGGLEHRPDGSFPVNSHPVHLRSACEESLLALGVDCIDLYQLHAPDPAVPFGDSVGELARLRQAGKIEYIGLSNVSLRQIMLAQTIAPIASVQNCFGPLNSRDLKNGVISHCEKNDIAYLAYSPFGGSQGRQRIASHAVLIRVAARYEATPFCIALAWVLNCSPRIIPIPGTRRIEGVRENMTATSIRLHKSDLTELNAALPG
jgi:aryl-alcohol dehydrogenase-like predicted oxidoreductase